MQQCLYKGWYKGIKEVMSFRIGLITSWWSEWKVSRWRSGQRISLLNQLKQGCYLGTVTCNVFSIKWTLIWVITELCAVFQTGVITKTKQLGKFHEFCGSRHCFSYCSWPPIQLKSRLLIGLSYILLCLNNSSQITKLLMDGMIKVNVNVTYFYLEKPIKIGFWTKRSHRRW